MKAINVAKTLYCLADIEDKLREDQELSKAEREILADVLYEYIQILIIPNEETYKEIVDALNAIPESYQISADDLLKIWEEENAAAT